jgi:hypothetical protein
VALGLGVAVAVGTGVAVGAGVGVGFGVGVAVGAEVGVAVGAEVGDGVALAETATRVTLVDATSPGPIRAPILCVPRAALPDILTVRVKVPAAEALNLGI